MKAGYRNTSTYTQKNKQHAMGGEWFFTFHRDSPHPFPLQEYQLFLLREVVPDTVSVIEEKHPDNNVYATFTYECHRHSKETTSGFQLYWNPLVTPLSPEPLHLHARCAPIAFKELVYPLQQRLVTLFPHHFSIELGDGLSGYGTEDLI